MIVLTLALILFAEIVPVKAEEIFTGDQIPAFNTAERVVAVALAEVGYKEGEGNNTKYGKWNGRNYIAWCGSFVSWCAHKAGVPTSSIKRYSDNCIAEYNWFKDEKRFENSDYIPKAGDIIFIDSDYKYDHTGIVVNYRDGIIYTVEGNSKDMVKEKQYSADDERIIGYGIPEYKIKTYSSDGDVGSQEVNLEYTSLTISAGSKITLTADITPETKVKTKVWTSSDSKIFTVNWKGEIVAKSFGTAYLTVEITNGKTVECKVTVN
jgi:hypothetical protein